MHPTKAPSLPRNHFLTDAERFAVEADAPNTLRAYRADWSDFSRWMRKRNSSPLPASFDDVALYLRHLAKTRKISTVERRLATINEVHKRAAQIIPGDNWVVRNTMKKLRRELGRPPVGKSPLLTEDIKKICSLFPSSLSGLRDKAIILLGFAGAMRRTELVEVDIEDIAIDEKEGLVLTIRKGKTDQVRAGRKVAIPFGKSENTCPVKATLKWIDAAKIESGPLLRSVNQHGRPGTTRLSSHSVAVTVKKYVKLLGKKSRLFSGHSLRSGLITSAAIAGVEERDIQNQSGHKSLTMLRRYIKDGNLFRNNAVKKLDL